MNRIKLFYKTPFVTQFSYLEAATDGASARTFVNNSGVSLDFPVGIEYFQTPARVVAVKSNATSTLDTTMTKLVFSATLPKTIPQTVAGGQIPTEVHDDYVYNQLRLLIDKSGLIVSDGQILVFQLYMRTGVRVTATVVYDLSLNEMYIVNNPGGVATERYRTLRKLTAEDVYIGNFRVIEKASNVIDTTDTSNWINRVVPDASNNFYTGALLSRVQLQKYTKTITTQAEAMLPLMMGMQQGGNFMQGILQYLMMKQQLSLQQQQKLEQMEKEFQYKMQLQQNQQDFKMKFAGLGNDLAQSSQVTSAPTRPGIGFVPATSPTIVSQEEGAPSLDNFDQQIGKFRDMLFNTAGLSPPGESVEHQVGETEVNLPSLRKVLPSTNFDDTSLITGGPLQSSKIKIPNKSLGTEIYGNGFAETPQLSSNYASDPMYNLLARMPDTIV